MLSVWEKWTYTLLSFLMIYIGLAVTQVCVLKEIKDDPKEGIFLLTKMSDKDMADSVKVCLDDFVHSLRPE